MSALGPSLAVFVSLLGPPSESESESPATDGEAVVDSGPSPDAPPPTDEAQLQPEPAPAPAPAPTPPPNGGFGSVESVSTSSNVQAPPPPPSSEELDDDGPRREMSAVVEIGYAQTDLGNAEGLDHHGLFLRLHFAFYPWVSKTRRVAGGLGFTYSYQGTNRWKLPSDVELVLDKSEAQQQQLLLNLDLLVRPHPKWFSIQPSAMIGMGFYSNATLFIADRPARIRKDEYAFVAAGSLALCTAWDIACVIGGAQILLDVRSFPLDAARDTPAVVDPWGWHVGLGFDVLRVYAKLNGSPS